MEKYLLPFVGVWQQLQPGEYTTPKKESQVKVKKKIISGYNNIYPVGGNFFVDKYTAMPYNVRDDFYRNV